MSDLDISYIVLWNRMTTNFMEQVSSVPKYEVDLSFEVHYVSSVNSYTSGTKLIISDLVFNDKLELNVAIPSGSTNKFIPYKFFDIISCRMGDDLPHEDGWPVRQDLLETVNNAYTHALMSFTFEEMKKLPATITDFVAAIASTHDRNKTANILNNGGEFIKEAALAEVDVKAFGEIDDFGMF